MSKSNAMVRHVSPRRKVFLVAKYRHHEGCAVRKREAFVRICMVSGEGPSRGLLRHTQVFSLGLCFRCNNDAG